MIETTTDLDRDAALYLDLAERIEHLTAQRDAIKARLAGLDPGSYPTQAGVTVTVSPPSRRFNIERAWMMLTAEQRNLCSSPDAKKVKAQLSEVLVDTCMDEGTGAKVVRIK